MTKLGVAMRAAVMLALLASASMAGAETTATLSPGTIARIDDALSGPLFRNGVMAVAVFDPSTSTMLHERNADTSVMPASCLKAITSACALHYLGMEHTFGTAVEAHGPVAQGTLRGDVVIRGGGDPALASGKCSDALSSAAVTATWVSAVKAAGIRRVRGDIVGDASLYMDEPLAPGWMWEDIGNYYAAGTSALSWHDNLFYATFQPGKAVGDPAKLARTSPALTGVTFENLMKTGPAGSGDNGFIRGAEGTWQRTLRGTLPLGGEFTIKGSLPDPPLAAAEALREALRGAGIQVTGKARSGALSPEKASSIIAETVSPPLHRIVHTLNKQSHNLFAEMLLVAIGAETGTATRGGGIEAVLSMLKARSVPLGGIQMADGSGLSRLNLVTARAMVIFLASVIDDPWFEVWLESLPHLGEDADLKNRHRDTALKGRVRAKTGYIGGVRGLCGYIDARSGHRVCFAIIANGYSGSLTEVDQRTDAILAALHDAL